MRWPIRLWMAPLSRSPSDEWNAHPVAADGEAFGSRLADALASEHAVIETRRFPDGESYLRLPEAVRGRQVVLNCTLADPDPKLASLIFAADAARELGAARVGLVAPYLAYMRQDRRFAPGEAITSRSFARLLSGTFDWLVTVDPHLHRYASLGEIYAIPTGIVHAAPLLSEWIGAHVERPLIIGPDSESEQWVAQAAGAIGAPHAVLTKHRHGDRSVSIDLPDLADVIDRQPVLVDDIASSGRTLIEAARKLQEVGMRRPVCVVIHPLFADDAYAMLNETVSRIVSTDTVPHPSNAMSVASLLAAEIKRLSDEDDRPKVPSQGGGVRHA